MTDVSRRGLALTAAAALIALATPALAQTATQKKDQAMTSLFKIITAKDEIVIGLSAEELGTMGGSDAGAVAKTLVSKGSMTAWQYAVRKAANGDLEQAPKAKVGLIANESLRVEPYATPLKVIAHE